MELSKADWLRKATKNIAKNNELANELYQYFFLTILEKPDDYVEKLQREGYLQFWAIRTLYLCINGNRHPFAESRIYDQYDVYELDFPEEPDLLFEREQEEQIEKIYNDGYIQFWTIRLLYLCVNGNRHPFGQSRIYDHYDVYDLHIFEEPDLLLEREAEEQIEEKRINQIKQVTETAYFYEREVFKLWCSGMSARAIYRQTNISVREVLRVIKLMKERCTQK